MSPTVFTSVSIFPDAIDWTAFDRDRRLRRALEFVVAKNGVVDLGEVACAAFVERTYLSRIFRARVGISFSHFLRAFRVALACNILKNENVLTIRVAFRVGFGSVRTLERTFRQVIGLSPREFRAQCWRPDSTDPAEGALEYRSSVVP